MIDRGPYGFLINLSLHIFTIKMQLRARKHDKKQPRHCLIRAYKSKIIISVYDKLHATVDLINTLVPKVLVLDKNYSMKSEKTRRRKAFDNIWYS